MYLTDSISFDSAVGKSIRKSVLQDSRRLQELLRQLETSASYHPETTHQLRKLTRKCSAAWQLLYRCHAIKRHHKTIRYWRSIRHILGPLRDADIRLESFNSFFAKPTSYQRQLLGSLEQSWLMHFKKVRVQLQDVDNHHHSPSKNLIEELNSSSLHYRWSKKSQRWLSRQIVEWQELAALSLKNPDRLHAFRISTKKLRNQFQCLKRCLPKESTWLSDLESLQDELGNHRDLYNTLAWIKETEQLVKLLPTFNRPLQKELQRWQKHCEQQERTAFRTIKQQLRDIRMAGCVQAAMR